MGDVRAVENQAVGNDLAPAAAWRSLVSSRPLMATRAPSARNRRAASRPMPLPPPVIRTTLPFEFHGFLLGQDKISNFPMTNFPMTKPNNIGHWEVGHSFN